MNIVLEEVRTFFEKLYCDCGEEMKADGRVYSTYPEKYSHTCENCGNTTTKLETYPKITHQTIK